MNWTQERGGRCGGDVNIMAAGNIQVTSKSSKQNLINKPGERNQKTRPGPGFLVSEAWKLFYCRVPSSQGNDRDQAEQ